MPAAATVAQVQGIPIARLDDVLWEIPASARPDLRVPARVFADEELLQSLGDGDALEQLLNVATLPGIVEASLAMPDVHQGYGFPVGGVAATLPPDGVVSPGGVGFDINCGVRLLALPLSERELGVRREALVHELSRAIPAGARRTHGLAAEIDLDAVLRDGAAALVARGLGTADDLERTESSGAMPGAEPALVSEAAHRRGRGQLGTLGSGNHFVELQVVEAVLEPEVAAAFGLDLGGVTVLLHSGSRGLGHQVCTDYVRGMEGVSTRYGFELPDRQLACAPLSSPEGRDYLAAMAAAANFAFANRQAMAHAVRTAVAHVLGPEAAAGTRQVYDVSHNTAKLEQHGGRLLCVHRKGATRAFPAGAPDLPSAYARVGQPVFLPGSMGTASYVLAGAPGSLELAFGSTAHGAGRRMSRGEAKRTVTGAEVRRELEARGIVVRCPTSTGLAEEAPLAYKDVDRVVDVVARAGLARPVARLVPLGVVKG